MTVARGQCRKIYSKMSVFGKFMREAMLARCRRIERAVGSAVEVQYSTLESLLERGRDTVLMYLLIFNYFSVQRYKKKIIYIVYVYTS